MPPPSISQFTSLFRRVYAFLHFTPLSHCIFIFHYYCLSVTNPPTTTTYPPNLKPLDVGIQFVLYVSFLLRFRFISCWLLLINSLDMQ